MATNSPAGWSTGLLPKNCFLRILQVNSQDLGGGAEQVAWNLFKAYQSLGHTSWLAVGAKQSQDPDVLTIPHRRLGFWAWFSREKPEFHSIKQREATSGLNFITRVLATAIAIPEQLLGIEDFNHPGSKRLLSLPPSLPDIVHVHNLHNNYFDLRYLKLLSRQVPVFLTLHDAWLLSGHCAHSLDCQQWQTGCGHCPDLGIYPAIRRDSTAFNWRRKRKIYKDSQLYVVTPSQWLMNKVNNSMLDKLEARVIHNGVNLGIFRPVDRNSIRERLNLPKRTSILLFTANNALKNSFKDYTTIEQAVTQVNLSDSIKESLIFLILGSDKPDEKQIGNVRIRYIPFERNPAQVAHYFQAADIYLHAAHADTFPNTVLESLACGTPVIATAVGGIPEQIDDGVTGFTVAPNDSSTMAERIHLLLTDIELRQRLSIQASQTARHRFDLNRQVNDYLNWYYEVLSKKNYKIKNLEEL